MYKLQINKKILGVKLFDIPDNSISSVIKMLNDITNYFNTSDIMYTNLIYKNNKGSYYDKLLNETVKFNIIREFES